MSSPRRLSDRELIARVRHLACRERQATACLVAHLAELDERRLYLAQGSSSLFTYCVEVLHLSDHAAFARIEVARAARRFPAIFDKLADGSVHLTAIGLLAPHLTHDNHCDLLEQATHKSKRQVEELVARIRPLPPVPSSVRKLPARASASANGTSTTGLELSGAALDLLPAQLEDGQSLPICAQAHDPRGAENAVMSVRECTTPAATPHRHRPEVTPLSADLYKVQFTADKETYTRLCQARELLRHQIHDGDEAAIIGLALKLLVEKLAQQKMGITSRPRHRREQKQMSAPSPPASGRQPSAEPRSLGQNSDGSPPVSRYLPVEIKRQVWARDQGRCRFVSRDGRRCTERGFLEFHHTQPFALGGPATVANIELRCRAHNQYESELLFGWNRSAISTRDRGELGPDRLEDVISPPG